MDRLWYEINIPLKKAGIVTTELRMYVQHLNLIARKRNIELRQLSTSLLSFNKIYEPLSS